MKFTLKQTRLGLRNSTTRIPFFYGNTCLTRCPQAVLEAVVECNGRVQSGYSGDCLPPGWFDKNPQLGFRQQIDDMLTAAALAQGVFAEEASHETNLFDAWLAAYHRVHAVAGEQGTEPLLATFGLSLVERAIIDALARAADLSFAQAVRENLFAIRPGEVHPELKGMQPSDWLPENPSRRVFVRQTVGLGDPLTVAEIPSGQRVVDGYLQAIEEYIQQSGVRYFKVKLRNDLDQDRHRLLGFAALVESHLGKDYRLTLDGNEQYKTAAELDDLIELLQGDPKLATLWDNTLAIEQPLARRVALDADHTAGVRELSRRRPVIIDESDGELGSYVQALECGYRGVSSKNCKGPIKSLLNAGLTWLRNDRGRNAEFLMTGEDLCSVGVIPTQADLCLAAALGLTHVERNGHHYHPGLSYLPPAQQQAALAAHGDMYARRHGVVSPHIQDGVLEIGSLQCVGFGFAVTPDFDSMQSPEEWDYASLGIDE